MPLKAQKAATDGPDPSSNIKRGWVQCLVTTRLSEINRMKPPRRVKGRRGVAGGRLESVIRPSVPACPTPLLPPKYFSASWVSLKTPDCTRRKCLQKQKKEESYRWQIILMRSLWLHIAEIVSGSTWLPITVNLFGGSEKQRFCPEVQPVGIYCIKSYEGKGPLHNITVINDTRPWTAALLAYSASYRQSKQWWDSPVLLSCKIILYVLYCEPRILYCSWENGVYTG